MRLKLLKLNAKDAMRRGDKIWSNNGRVILLNTCRGFAPSIAAASIIAKIKHDNWMRECEDGKIYGWASNKGYGTKQHLDAIKEHGPSEHHRTSFISHIVTKTAELF